MGRPFRYRLQAALEHAAAVEREARGAVARCRAAYAAALDAISVVDGWIAAIVAAQNRSAPLRSVRAAQAFTDFDACVRGLRIERARRQATATGGAARLAEAHDTYVRAARRHAALARLRERALADERRRTELAEAAELDECNSRPAARLSVS